MHPSRAARRAGGVFYTPAAVVKYIVRQTLAPLLASAEDGGPQRLTIVDPACGAGAFLVEAYRALLDAQLTFPERRRVLLDQIFGVELDGQAAHETRLALASVALPAIESEMTSAERGYELDALLAELEANIRQGDALLGPDFRRENSRSPPPVRRPRAFDWQAAFPRVFQAGGFGAVLMNPPYVNIRELSKIYDAPTKEYLAAQYRCARGAYDLYVLFVEKAFELLRPGGQCGMITPNKLAALDYAGPCRELLLAETTLRLVADVSSLKVFPEAGVYPYIMLWEKSPPDRQHLVRVLTARSADDLSGERPVVCLSQADLSVRGGFSLHGSLDVESRVPTAPLAERATLASGATGFSASQLAGQLVEHDELPAGSARYEFIVSGNIDRYEIETGQVRFMKRAFAQPVLPVEAAGLSKNKQRLYAGPKLVIAGMTKRLEAALDSGGLALGVQVYAAADCLDDPRYLLALLNSRLLSHLFRTRFSAKQLSGGFLAINKGQLAKLPIRLVDEGNPADVELRSSIIRQVDVLLDLYALRRREHRPRERERLLALANLADRRIDDLVYRLYRMTGAEIGEVERAFATPAGPMAQVAESSNEVIMNARQVALVTGAGKRRIGSHVAEALAERGYALAIHYRSSDVEAVEAVAEYRARGIEAEAFQADLTDERAVKTLVESVLAHFGRLDVLVNCAAIWQRKRLEDITAADVRLHFDTNALGTFLCSQQAGLAMTRQPEGGSIINLGDWAEARPYLDYAAYFPSKGAVSALTRSLAVELASRNPRVRVNCILPGPVMLPPELSAEERAQSIAGTLVKREGSPANIVLAVLHFIDNDFVTGVCLPVDGGRTICG